ncbi:MAG: class I SAM-dependent methyltransferase [Bdellovibrionales bacterium]|nr:class I SAM-dependent methyltransferase [Bdellovibrionales bacterium]
MSKKKSSVKEFDKYELYLKSVQSPENDVKFLNRLYKELRGKKATILREDFCGTFNISCEWVKLDSSNKSIGVDLDPEPIQYGKQTSFLSLTDKQKERVQILQKNVLDPALPKADIVDAQNFSYSLFKTRKQLLEYFSMAHKGLNKDGIFVIDCFGGSQCMEPNEEETEHDGFSYFWDQDSYDPVTGEAMFYIHFKRKGEKKREKVFTYDWRLWSIPELKEVMEDAGFSKVHVYWEGTDEEGEGDGEFTRVTQGEDCESWVAYVVGEK